MGRGRTDSLSSVEESKDTKVSFDDFDEPWSSVMDSAARALKKVNPDVKKFVIKGKAHQSSTVKEHTEVVSVQARNKDEEYLGSAHIDKNGNIYPNEQFKKTAEARKSKDA